jgi:XTP/dITP diphosphohydrolase
MPPGEAENPSPRIVFATRNEGKISEMLALLRSSPWSIERLPDTVGEFEETGETFGDNARGKALHAAAALSLPVLADDSGLVIDALDGRPGVRSARYLRDDASAAERNLAILEEMLGKSAEERTARFVCHVALAHRDNIVHETTGVCEGVIGREPRGEHGFGYDPIFVVPELGKTFAEIGREEKSARSHRGRAVRAMADFLRLWKPS